MGDPEVLPESRHLAWGHFPNNSVLFDPGGGGGGVNGAE